MRFIWPLIAAAVAVWVYKDAKKRGYETLAAIGWMLGVFFLMIVFLPLYLIIRNRRGFNIGLFSSGYVPGGEHHVRITDETFEEAQKLITGNTELRNHYKQLETVKKCVKYETHDFPVTEIFGSFLLSHELQEEKNGIPENLRMGNVQLGRKDQIVYDRYVQKYKDRIKSKIMRKQASWDRKGMGGKLFSAGVDAAYKGIAKATTGKNADIREFEQEIANYLCGDSLKAKEYLLKFAFEFGGDDEGLVAVAYGIICGLWLAEFAKYNRSKLESLKNCNYSAKIF